MGKRGALRGDVGALCAIAAVALLILWPVTLGDRVLIPADLLLRMEPWHAYAREHGFERVQNPILDPIQQHYAWRKFAGEQLRKDEVPLWNPYMSAGTPFIANNQSAAFYPETWLFALLPVERAFGFAALLYTLLAGGFMYWYLRVLGCRPQAAVLGALPFMLSGFAVGWMAFLTLRSVPAWLPLMLVGHEKTVRGARGPWWLLSAFAVGMQFLAGHLHISLFILMIFAAYVLFRAAWPPQPERRWTGVAAGIGSLLVGTLIGAVQILPVVELVGAASRDPHPYSYIVGFALKPASALTGLMPDIFGNPVDYNYWGEYAITPGRAYLENVFYAGVATLVLVALALCLRRERLIWFWAVVGLLGIGLAWGTGLFWLLYQLFPPVRTLPGINRAVIILDVALAVLAGLGMEGLLKAVDAGEGGRVKRLMGYAVAALAAVGLVGGLATWFFTGGLEQTLPGIGSYTMAQIGLFMLLLALTAGFIALTISRPHIGAALLLVVLAADLGRFAYRFIPSPPAEYLSIRTRAIPAMQAPGGTSRMMSLPGEQKWISRMPPNLPMAYGLECVEASDSLLVRRYEDMLQAARDESGQLRPELPLWDALNVRYCLTPRELDGRWQSAGSFETNLYESTSALPRFHSPPHIRSATSYAEAMRYVTSTEFRPAEELVMVGDLAPDQGEFAAGEIVEWAPNRLTVRATQSRRWWMLGDSFYPGWHAFAGGEELPIMPADYALRGVYVPEASEQIDFIYYPASYALGAFLTALGFGVIAFVMVLSWRRRRGGAEAVTA
ncbi:MAG TPA: hypothetical protein DGT21_18050 [Armatimonadetes bacterium]|nr:hypothetical protein [Armatimonadota bacterium]